MNTSSKEPTPPTGNFARGSSEDATGKRSEHKQDRFDHKQACQPNGEENKLVPRDYGMPHQARRNAVSYPTLDQPKTSLGSIEAEHANVNKPDCGAEQNRADDDGTEEKKKECGRNV
ncbi:hypothetical protein J1614_005596 [Plenodomus biglobosus]|nr:hypothetical protein J1614_005596 [Plenodomus biglobosus]